MSDIEDGLISASSIDNSWNSRNGRAFFRYSSVTILIIIPVVSSDLSKTKTKDKRIIGRAPESRGS